MSIISYLLCLEKKQESQILQKNEENSNSSISPVHDVRIGLEPMDHKSSGVQDVNHRLEPLDPNSLAWHHHTFTDETRDSNIDEVDRKLDR